MIQNIEFQCKTILILLLFDTINIYYVMYNVYAVVITYLSLKDFSMDISIKHKIKLNIKCKFIIGLDDIITLVFLLYNFHYLNDIISDKVADSKSR